jgi:putative YphP/YqiW family bacilliredoxin
MTYPEPVINKHRSRVEATGASPLTSREDVEAALRDDCVVVVNSVCGCAANTLIPTLEATLADTDITAYQVFAGVDDEATAAARNRFGEYGPSSPAVAIIKDGEVSSYIAREDILRHEEEDVEGLLRTSFDTLT